MHSINKQTIKIRSWKYMNSLFVWNFKASFAGKWVEFQDFREYSPWDDAKYIDWARSSMESSLVMRRYKEEKSSDIYCYLDIRESLDFHAGVKKKLLLSVTEFLYAASIASSEKFGWFIDRWYWVTYVNPSRNPQSLHQLYNFTSEGYSSDMSLRISSLMNPKLKRSIIFVVSDSMNIDEKSFKAASMKHDLVYIYISSHFEDTLSDTGVSLLRWQGWNIAIDLSDTEKKKEYALLRVTQKKDFSSRLSKMWIDSMFLSERSSLQWEFLKLMKQRINFAR